jgi:AcrR family transcriptional regulator
MAGRTKSRQPRTKPAEERREELMDAAQRLFLKRGVDRTTVEEITSGANVAKGTFYLYFSSKEEVLAALGRRFADRVLEKIQSAVAQKNREDWRGKLGAWARAGVAGYLEAIQLHDIVFYGALPRSREGLVQNILIDDLATLLEAGADSQAWRIQDPRATAVFLFSGLHGAVDFACAQRGRIDSQRTAREVQNLFFRVAV